MKNIITARNNTLAVLQSKFNLSYLGKEEDYYEEY